MASVCVCIKQSRAYASLTYAPIIHLYQIPSHIISKNYNDLKNTNTQIHHFIIQYVNASSWAWMKKATLARKK